MHEYSLDKQNWFSWNFNKLLKKIGWRLSRVSKEPFSARVHCKSYIWSMEGADYDEFTTHLRWVANNIKATEDDKKRVKGPEA